MREETSSGRFQTENQKDIIVNRKTLRVKSKTKVKDNEQVSALFIYFIDFVFFIDGLESYRDAKGH